MLIGCEWGRHLNGHRTSPGLVNSAVSAPLARNIALEVAFAYYEQALLILALSMEIAHK